MFSFSRNSVISTLAAHLFHIGETKRFAKRCHENKWFLDNVPKSIKPYENTSFNGWSIEPYDDQFSKGWKLTFKNNSAIYDDDGEMIWNSLTGLCGKAVEVK